MQVRYQAALRPENKDYIPQLSLDRRKIDAVCGRRAAVAGGRFALLLGLRVRVVEPVTSAADREAFFVQQLADAADEQDFVVLVIAPVAPALHRLQLRELVFQVRHDVRLPPARVAHLPDSEVAVGRDGREFSFPAAWL